MNNSTSLNMKINATSGSEIDIIKSKDFKGNHSELPSNPYRDNRVADQIKVGEQVQLTGTSILPSQMTVTADNVSPSKVNMEGQIFNNQDNFVDDQILSNDKLLNDEFIQIDNNDDGSDPEDKFMLENLETAQGHLFKSPIYDQGGANFGHRNGTVLLNGNQEVINFHNPNSFMNQYQPLSDDIKKHLVGKGRIQSAHHTSQNRFGFQTINTNSGLNLPSRLQNQRQDSYAIQMFKGSDNGRRSINRRPKNSNFIRMTEKWLNKSSKSQRHGSISHQSGIPKTKSGTISNFDNHTQGFGAVVEEFTQGEGKKDVRQIYGGGFKGGKKSGNMHMVVTSIDRKTQMFAKNNSPKKHSLNTIKMDPTPIEQVDMFMEQNEYSSKLIKKSKPYRIQSAQIQSKLFKQQKEHSEFAYDIGIQRSPEGSNSRKLNKQWNIDQKTNHSSFKDVSDKDFQNLDKINELKQDIVRFKTEAQMLRKDQKRYEDIIKKVIDPQTWQSQEEVSNPNQSKEELRKAFQKQNSLFKINFQLLQQFQDENGKLKTQNDTLENQLRILKRKTTHTKFVELEVEKTQLIIHCQQQQQMIQELLQTKGNNKQDDHLGQSPDIQVILDSQNNKIQQLQSLLHTEKTKNANLLQRLNSQENNKEQQSPIKELSHESEVNLAKMELLEANQNNKSLKALNEKLVSHIKSLETEVQALNQAQYEVISPQVDQFKAKNSGLKKHDSQPLNLQELQDQIQNDQQLIENLKSQVEKLISDHESSIEQKDSLIERQQLQLKDLQQQVDNQANFQGSFDDLQQKIDSLLAEKKQLEQKMNSRTLSPVSDTSKQDQPEAKPLEIKFDNLELDKDSEDIQNQIQAMKIKSSQKEQIQRLVQQMLLKFADVNQQYNLEISQLKQDAMVFQDSLVHLEEYEKKQIQEKSEQQEQYGKLQEKLSNQTREKDEFIEVIQKYEGIVSDYETQITKVKDESATEIKKLTEKMEEQIEINKKLQDSSQENNTFDQSRDKSNTLRPKGILRQKSKDAVQSPDKKSNTSSLQSKVNTSLTQKTVQQLSDKIKEIEGENSRLKKQVEQLKAQSKPAKTADEQSSRKLSSKRDSMKQEVEELKKQIQLMEAEYKDAEAQNRQNILKFQAEIQEKTETMIGLNETNDQLTNQVMKLQSEVKELSGSNAQQIQVLNQEKEVLLQKVVDANNKLQKPKPTESKSIQVILEDKSKKAVKFIEDDTKILGYENKLKDQSKQMNLIQVKNELIVQEYEDIVGQIEKQNEHIKLLQAKIDTQGYDNANEGVLQRLKNQEYQNQIQDLSEKYQEMKESNLKLVAVIQNQENTIEQYEASILNSTKYGEDQLKTLKEIQPKDFDKQRPMVSFEDVGNEETTRRSEITRAFQIQSQSLQQSRDELQSLQTQQKHNEQKLQEIESQFYLLKQTIGSGNVTEAQELEYKTAKKEIEEKLKKIVAEVEEKDSDVNEKSDHLQIMKALKSGNTNKNFEQITLVLYREKLLKYIEILHAEVNPLKEQIGAQQDKIRGNEEIIDIMTQDIGQLREKVSLLEEQSSKEGNSGEQDERIEQVKKQMEEMMISHNEQEEQLQNEIQDLKQQLEASIRQTDTSLKQTDAIMKNLSNSDAVVSPKSQKQLSEKSYEQSEQNEIMKEQPEVKDKKIEPVLSPQFQIVEVQQPKASMPIKIAQQESQDAKNSVKSEQNEPTHETYYDEEYESEAPSQKNEDQSMSPFKDVSVKQKDSIPSPASVRNIQSPIHDFNDISGIPMPDQQDQVDQSVVQVQNALKQDNTETDQIPNKGIVDFIEQDTEHPSQNMSSLKMPKQKPTLPQNFKKLLKKYQQRVKKVQQSKKPLTWLEIYKNFMLYIEDIGDLDQALYKPAPTQKNQVLQYLNQSLISVENLAIVTIILRISDETHPLDVNEFLSVYMYKNKYSQSNNEFKNQLICVKNLIKELFVFVNDV